MTRPSTPTIVFASVVAIFSIVAIVLLFAGARNAPPATPQPSAAVSGPTLVARTPVVPGAPTPEATIAPALALDVSWDQAGQVTIVCWTLTTTPPQRNAAASEKIEGPGVVGSAQARIGTGAEGVAKGGFVVNQLGTFTVSATVGERTTTQVIAMRSATGPKPCG